MDFILTYRSDISVLYIIPTTNMIEDHV